MMIESIAAIALAFLLGSFPTAYVLGRFLARTDVRQHGSGNPGALNAYRRLGKTAGLLVLAIDAGKGALALYIGQQIGAPGIAIYVAAVAIVLGHNFSPFLGFKGGKGAATALGISAFVLWQLTAITIGVGAVLFLVTRRPVLTMTGVFLVLNALTIATGQTLGLILVCLILTFVVGSTHFFRQYPQFMSAIRQRQWRRLMSIE